MALTKVKGSVWDSEDNRLSYSVLDYGAKGDGVTDDTSAIQSAIDAAETANGGSVYFPSGTYIVSNQLSINLYGITLYGDGWAVDEPFNLNVALYGSVIKLADGAFNDPGDDGKGIIHIDYGGGGIQAKMGVRIQNLCVFGNRSTDTASPDNSGTYNNNNLYGHGIRIEGARNVFIQNVGVFWCAEDGIHTETGGAISFSPGGEIYGVTCVGNGENGIKHAGGDTNITNCNCGYNGQDGINWVSSGSLVGVHCWDNFSDGLVIDAMPDVAVTGGYFYDNRRAGIAIGDVQRFSVVGAVCQDNGKDTGETSTLRAGITVTNNGAEGVIVGCVSSNKEETTVTGQQYGIRVNGTASVKISACKECPGGGNANGVAFISNNNEWEELTIASGAISVTGNKHKIAGEGGVADNLDTINGQTGDDYLILRASDSAVTITVRDAGVSGGNIFLDADTAFTMDNSQDMLMLTRIDSNYYELTRSNVGT